MRSPGNRYALVIKTAIVVALTGLVLTRVDISAVARHLTSDKLVVAILVQPVMLLGLSMAGVRFAILTAKRPLPTSVSMKALLLAYGANVVLPARVSELLKATYIRQHAGVPLSTGMAAIFVERVADLLIMGVLALVSAVSLLSEQGSALWMVVAALVLLAGVPSLAPYAGRLTKYIPSLRARSFVQHFIAHCVERITHRAFLTVIGLSVLIWLSALLAISTILSATGSISIGFDGALIVLIAALLGGAVPALPGGFGTYEAAVVFALQRYGYQLDEALALALTLHLSQIVLVCAIAPLIAMREKIGLQSVLADAVAEFRSKGLSNTRLK